MNYEGRLQNFDFLKSSFFPLSLDNLVSYPAFKQAATNKNIWVKAAAEFRMIN